MSQHFIDNLAVPRRVLSPVTEQKLASTVTKLHTSGRSRWVSHGYGKTRQKKKKRKTYPFTVLLHDFATVLLCEYSSILGFGLELVGHEIVNKVVVITDEER